MSLRDDLAEHIRRGQDRAAKQNLTSHAYALEVGIHAGTVTGRRPWKVDSAELIGFIRNNDPTCDAEAAVLADAIVDHFHLED